MITVDGVGGAAGVAVAIGTTTQRSQLGWPGDEGLPNSKGAHGDEPQAPELDKLLGQQHRAPDQAKMAVRLRMVAESPFLLRVVLLRQQAGRTGRVQHLLEQLLGVGTSTGPQVGLDQPAGADVEAALAPGKTVIPP